MLGMFPPGPAPPTIPTPVGSSSSIVISMSIIPGVPGASLSVGLLCFVVMLGAVEDEGGTGCGRDENGEAVGNDVEGVPVREMALIAGFCGMIRFSGLAPASIDMDCFLRSGARCTWHSS
jgi:hypothetical protein